MKTIKGPAIFLAQFAGGGPHLQNFNDMCKWAEECGFVGVQLPSWDGRVMDLAKAAESKSYCDELKGVAAKHGIEITELAAHLQGQLVAVHPAYDLQFDNFAPKEVHGNPAKRQVWAVEQMKLVAKASKNLGLRNCAAFPGALAWPYLYPWPQRPPGLIEAAFDELAKRWKPILDVFKDNGQNCCFEVHPGEDIFDGETFEMFLERVNGHEACNILFDPSHFVLQQLDYLAYIDIYTRPHQDVSREGRGIPSHGQTGRVLGLCVLDEPRRPLPFARRRPGGFQRHLLEVRRLRLRGLGRARMGMRAQASRRRRARRRPVHQEAHHPRHREGVR